MNEEKPGAVRWQTDDASRPAPAWRMLYAIAVILVLLWLLGLMSSATMGGFIHVLLAIAVIVILIRLILGRNPI